MTETTTPVAAPAARTNSLGVTHRTSSYNIDPKRICLKPNFNKRFDFGNLEELADQIETELRRDPSGGGLLYPLHVRRIAKTDPRSKDFDFEVEHGNRRTLAIQDILIKVRHLEFPMGVKAEIIYKGQDELTSLVHMYVTNSGKPFNPLEEAANLKAIVSGDTALTVKQLSKAIGKSEASIKESLELLNASPDVQSALHKREITVTNAKAIAKVAKGDHEAQAELSEVAKAAKGGGVEAKKARAKLETKLREKHLEQARLSGKKLKMRSLTNPQLSSLGAEVAVLLFKKAKEANCHYDGRDTKPLLEKVMKDEKLTMAFTLGALQALLVAGGVTLNLDI